MNIKEQTDRIKSILQTMKSASIRFSNVQGKLFPFSHSYDAFFGSTAIVDEQMEKLGQLITRLPLYSSLEAKKPSAAKKEVSFDVRTFHGRHPERIKLKSSIESHDVTLSLAGSSGRVFQDARVRGGGVKNEYIKTQLPANPSLYGLTDAGRWDGMPTNASSSFIVYLPESTKNTFSEDHIRSVVEKYAALGTVPIIVYYSEPAA